MSNVNFFRGLTYLSDLRTHPIQSIGSTNDVIARLYASWTLEQHEGDLAVHNVLEPQSLALVRSDVLAQSEALAPESVLLTDVLAPPDFILNSALGHSSGDVYHQLHQAFLSVPNGFKRAPFWQEYTENARKKAKL